MITHEQSPQEVTQSGTTELFIAGMEFIAKWHEAQAKKEEEKGWTERAKDHRYHAEDIRIMIKQVKNP